MVFSRAIQPPLRAVKALLAGAEKDRPVPFCQAAHLLFMLLFETSPLVLSRCSTLPRGPQVDLPKIPFRRYAPPRKDVQEEVSELRSR